MSPPPVDAATRRALKALRGRLTEAQLRRIFAAVRSAPDETLLELVRSAPSPASGARDPLAQEIASLFRPILAPAAEKADLLLAAARARSPHAPEAARGLTDAVRRLRRVLTPDEIRAAAADVMADMQRRYSHRERVT